MGQRDGFCSAVHAQLAIDADDLSLNRIAGDNQGLCHFSVGLPGNEQAQHPLLLGTEGFNQDGLSFLCRKSLDTRGSVLWKRRTLWLNLLRTGRLCICPQSPPSFLPLESC